MILSKKTTSIALTLLLCSVSPMALAQETQPGDACVGEDGFFRRAADDDPGPAITGQNFMYCDGANWLPFIRYDDPTDSVIFRAPAAAPADATFGNSQWSLWLDESNDEFELKAKKADGSVISATVGGGGSGLWTDEGTYIALNPSSAYMIEVGQALPATFDDNGTRMFFYPDKEAFRGGEITGGNDAWTDANIGTHSFAWGLNVQAQGNHSVAMGNGTTAGGNYSVALGQNTSASYYGAIAIGASSQATYWNALSLGLTAQATGSASVAIGYYSQATGYASTALGRASLASGVRSVVMGTYSVSSGQESVAIGGAFTNRNFSTGNYSTTIGHGVTASGAKAVAIGTEVVAGSGTAGDGAGDGAMAFGLQTAAQATDPKVTGDRSAVFFMDGNTANANSTFDFTDSDTLAVVGGKFMLSETQAQGAAKGCIQFNPTDNELQYSDDCSSYTAFADLAPSPLWTDEGTYIALNPASAFMIESGQALPASFDDNGTRMFFYPNKEAFRGGEITGGNDAWTDANIGTHSFAWGQNVQATGTLSVAMGNGTTASGSASVAMGWVNSASGSSSVAMGYATYASGDGSLAMGLFSAASGKNSIAMGGGISGGPVASGSYSLAIGYYGSSTGFASVAMGSLNSAFGSSSVAMGSSNSASGSSSVAMGASNRASGIEAVALGSEVWAGSGTAADGAGDGAMAFGLQTASQTTDPKVTGDRSAVFFMDGNTANANSTFDFTDSDTLAVVGGKFMLSETQAQGAAKGCIQFNPTDNELQYSDDCSSYTAFADLGGGGTPAGSSNQIQFNDSGAFAADSLFVFDSASNYLGIGNSTPSVAVDVTGDIEYTGTIADVSDERLKANIENLPGGQLDKILALRGVSFDMKDNLDGPREYGFVAQDVQLLYPSLVYQRGDDGMLSLNYIGLIAPMVEAMEEQNEIIKAQGELIKQLEARLSKLEKEQEN